MKFRHLLTAAALVTAIGAHAQGKPISAEDHAAHHTPATAANDTAPAQVDGEVRKIDRAQGKLTLRHGPLKHLDMPGMTMVFRVADPKLLDGLKEGDKVRFSADKVNGAFTVIAIEPVK
ncbi:MAG: copper-binding protein [Oxalobacteraceae bacterium]|nr:MAG: copper-binding protein [Oxalobacteraceae bacterium]